ncbi:unannotated protein [freshwater metagenome]|uniref:Unannotated protein n=1 Tax=freshwater metagenome TaxID=449393 RepID=A0A6J7BUV3_9ZZZZ|nr:signal peptidase I [Actinomycetota bacterium]
MTSIRYRFSNQGVQSWLLTGLTAVLFGAWFFTLAPIALAGPASYVIVDGISMEPLLHTGDLVVARKAQAYAVGDLVVLHIAADKGVNGWLIHRLVSGDAQAGWKTKGDNNTSVDPWTVRNDQVAGTYWRLIPDFGRYLAWVNQHPLGFAGICTALTLLFYIPLRRRKFAPVLTESLATAKKEPRRDGRTNQEYGVLWITSLASLTAIALVGLLGTSHQLVTVRGAVAAAALAWAGGFTIYFIYRLYDGRGVQEPARSMYALSGRLYLVVDFPALDSQAREVSSAVALRTIAEKYRMPVLHRVDPGTGHHEFLLLTLQLGAFIWRPELEPATTMVEGDVDGDAGLITSRGGRPVAGVPVVGGGPGFRSP